MVLLGLKFRFDYKYIEIVLSLMSGHSSTCEMKKRGSMRLSEHVLNLHFILSLLLTHFIYFIGDLVNFAHPLHNFILYIELIQLNVEHVYSITQVHSAGLQAAESSGMSLCMFLSY